MSDRKLILARDVMNNDFIMMDGISTVQEGINSMKRSNVHTLLISRRHEHDEFGIVVLADIAKKVLAANKAPERVNLYEIMSKPVLGLDPDMDIRYCARIFYRFGVSIAPVISEKKVLGIISYNELVLHGMLDDKQGD